jgi:hypothetical protein
MPAKSDTYRVLIASPSDLAAEAVVLLPAKWETHTLPQSGIRPQEAP